MAQIYITERAKKQIGTLSKGNKRLYKEVLDTIDNLQQDNRQGGTRVKKLHGVADLYEARLNSGDRMLFTQSGNELYIQLVYVVHDKVNLIAKNTTFVDSNAGLIQVDNTIDEFEIPEEEILSIYATINTSEKIHVIDEETLIRLFESENSADISFKLKLLPEQEEILHKPLPLLISGGAGSGKSTISIYRLYFEAEQLIQHEEKPKLLYISENERLIKDAKEQFLYLCSGQENEQRMRNAVEFRSFNSLIKLATFDEYSRLINVHEFKSEFAQFKQGKPISREMNSISVYQELLSVIGSYALPQQRYLTKDQYINLPIYEAPLFFDNRELIWKIHEWYMDLEQEKGFFDINDWINNALIYQKLPKYDFIIGDEIQDFNRAKILLSLKMLKTGRKGAFLFAGDSKQTITESQFTWAGLKRFLCSEFGIKEIEQSNLAVNVRNPRPVAELGESLFRIPRQFGIKEHSITEINAPLPGNEAVVINSEDVSIIQSLTGRYTDDNVVIVSDKKSEEKLKAECQINDLKVPFMLLPHEAKGLEFQNVCLWNLSSSSESMPKWGKISKQGKADTEEDKHFILTEIRRIYVSLTRALHDIYIIENKVNTFWKNREIGPISFSSEENLKSLLIERQRPAEIEESIVILWANRAQHFYDQEQYERCLDCLNRISNSLDEPHVKLKMLAKAHLLMENGEFEKAGDIFANVKAYELSFKAYDHIGLFDKIANLFDNAAFDIGILTESGRTFAQQRDVYKVRAFDRKKNFLGSGRLCMRNGKYTEAAERFKKGNYDNLLEECLIQALDNDKFDEKLLKIASLFFKERKNYERNAQVLKLIK